MGGFVNQLIKKFWPMSFRLSRITTYLSRDTRFPKMWYVRPAKPQISLRISAVWSEPLLVVVFPLGPFSMALRHALFLERHAFFWPIIAFFLYKNGPFSWCESPFSFVTLAAVRDSWVFWSICGLISKKSAPVYRQDSVHALDKVKLTSLSYWIHNDRIYFLGLSNVCGTS